MTNPLYAILLDGGFITKKLRNKLNRDVTAEDVVEYCECLQKIRLVQNYELLRIYYYDARVIDDSFARPVSGNPHTMSSHHSFRRQQALFDKLETTPGFALRMGSVKLGYEKWKLGPAAIKSLMQAPRALTDEDFLPSMTQKGVDMRIGLDIARLSIRELVRMIIVATSDSDFIPAFKFARREGVKVVLDTLGHHAVSRELKVHSDFVVS